MIYFAYGSNMSRSRLLARIASARYRGPARLAGYELRFHKVSFVDGSGKADAFHTGRAGDCVQGVLYSIRKTDLDPLDGIEGAGHGYQRRKVRVREASGRQLMAETYLATRINPDLRPMDWYLEHVLRGAREAGLPGEYLAGLEKVETIRDTNVARRRRELSVYH